VVQVCYKQEMRIFVIKIYKYPNQVEFHFDEFHRKLLKSILALLSNMDKTIREQHNAGDRMVLMHHV
jgi:hypothetical protein